MKLAESKQPFDANDQGSPGRTKVRNINIVNNMVHAHTTMQSRSLYEHQYCTVQ